MLHFRERSRSKCGTFDYLDHRPGGGDKKVSITADMICMKAPVLVLLLLLLLECED